MLNLLRLTRTSGRLAALLCTLAIVGCSSSDGGPKSGRDAGWALTISGDGVDREVDGPRCVGAGSPDHRMLTCIEDGNHITVVVKPDRADITFRGADDLNCASTATEFEVLDEDFDSYYVTMSGTLMCNYEDNVHTPTFEFYLDRGK